MSSCRRDRSPPATDRERPRIGLLEPYLQRTGCREIGAIRSCRIQFGTGNLTLHNNSAAAGNGDPFRGLNMHPIQEQTMTNLKILSVAAAVAVAIPAFAATPSFAQNTKVVGVGPGGQSHTIGTFRGGGGPRAGGGGGWHGGGPRFGGGWHNGGGYRGGGFGPGFAAGAIIGSGIAANSYYGNSYYGNSYGYYGGGPAYSSSYYDDEPDAVEVAPSGGDVDYCVRTYKSYNVRTGTYLGYDGQRHACP
jgi:hypothetical protein